MKVTMTNLRVKCDVGGCNRDAEFVIRSERTGVHTGIYLCADCARAMRDALTKSLRERRA